MRKYCLIPPFQKRIKPYQRYDRKLSNQRINPSNYAVYDVSSHHNYGVHRNYSRPCKSCTRYSKSEYCCQGREREIKGCFNATRERSKVKFVYSSSQININQIVSINSTKETLGSALEVLLKPLGIKFSVQDNRMIILSKVVDNNLNLLKANGLPNAQAESNQGRKLQEP
jgi:hypothetical protein